MVDPVAKVELADHDVARSIKVCVVGPLPPPSGGMANQCEQLTRLLRAEGLQVELVCTNRPYRPALVESIPVLRALFRLVPYVAGLWRAAGRANVMHVLANSGWAWHLFAAPALIVARIREVPVVVNYRGGNADAFFASAPRFVLRMLAKVALRITPSVFLVKVFQQYGLSAQVIPNIIDLSRFTVAPARSFAAAPHIVVTRNLERIYDIPTAIRAFAHVRRVFPGARLTVAGSGPELQSLRALVNELALGDSVQFPGCIDNAEIPFLYAAADCLVNPSTVDNMPNSILEAFASGVPVVSTNAGGIPDMVIDGVSALLVPIGDDDAIARQVIRLLEDPAIAEGLRSAGLAEAEKYGWPRVKVQWLDAYRRAVSRKVTV
jgi:glycosyltransferase involved in cell wall biosynthesis